MLIKIDYQYDITGTLGNNEEREQKEIQSSVEVSVEEDWDYDEVFVYTQAFEGALNHFYTFHIEKPMQSLRDIKIHIKDVDVKYL